MIYFQTDGVEMPQLDAGRIGRWLGKVAGRHGYRLGDIAYRFCSDEVILDANRQYLSHDYFTDIITFDYTDGDKVEGDLLISLQTVRSNAEMLGVDYESELLRVVVHGVFHLCGLHDKSEEERAEMEAAENAALELYPEI